MKSKNHPHSPMIQKKNNNQAIPEDLLEACIRKGLIEKTPFGYIFSPEFFETLELYEE